MPRKDSHEELISGLYKQMKQVVDSSEQAVYIYHDDIHKICNERFARLLGFKSAAEWSKSEIPFAENFVDTKSQQALVSAYQDAMNRLMGSAIDVTWRTKSGGTVDTNVILVPVSYEGHLFALHFISQKK